MRILLKLNNKTDEILIFTFHLTCILTRLTNHFVLKLLFIYSWDRIINKKSFNYRVIGFFQQKVNSMFFGGGGFPFGFGGEHPGQQQDDYEDVQQDQDEADTDYYQVLSVQKTATQQQIKKSYVNLVKEHHPDRGGSPEQFQQIELAFQTLGDPEKRQIYDKYGKRGPPKTPFANSHSLNQKKQLPKVQPTKRALEVTLEQVYNGDIISFEYQRMRTCQPCQGKGGKDAKKCKSCKGQGAVIKLAQLGPGMYTQIQQKCEECNGQGDILGNQGKCLVCQGKKIIKQQKTIKVPIDRGLPDNQPIVLSGQGNQVPDALAGDLILISQEKPHQFFTRKGADLYIKKGITLLDAICGFSFNLKHLDNRQYVISSNKGEIIFDSSKKVVKSLGMPFYKQSTSYGNLIIEFNVQMPKRGEINKEDLQVLAKILPGKVCQRPQGHDYEMLEDFDHEYVNSNEEGGKKDQEQQEGQQVGCQAQ